MRSRMQHQNWPTSAARGLSPRPGPSTSRWYLNAAPKITPIGERVPCGEKAADAAAVPATPHQTAAGPIAGSPTAPHKFRRKTASAAKPAAIACPVSADTIAMSRPPRSDR
jgi:hypothetical protein